MNRRAALLAAGVTLGLVTVSAVTVAASTPSSSGTVSPPLSGQTATYSWTGTIPGGVNANSDCSQSVSDALNDHHTVTFSIPTRFYSKHTLLATFTVTPTPAVDDVILTLERAGRCMARAQRGSAADGVAHGHQLAWCALSLSEYIL